MAASDEALPSESSGQVGGWFGQVMAGVTPAVIDGLGWKIRNKLGLEDTSRTPPTHGTAQPPDISRVGSQPSSEMQTLNTLLWVGGGITALVVLLVLFAPQR